MSSAGELITTSVGGKTFLCSRRTAAHLEWTEQELARTHPGCRLVVFQGCYNAGVEKSVGTHDYDAVLDVQIGGLGWWSAQRFLRELGWAAWYRQPPAFSEHIHMISLGYPGKVGKFVDGGLSLYGEVRYSSQVDDYYRHALGLKGQHQSGADNSWFPPGINATIFDYEAWLEADMGYGNWSDEDKKLYWTDFARHFAKGVNEMFRRKMGGTGVQFGPMFQAIYKRITGR